MLCNGSSSTAQLNFLLLLIEDEIDNMISYIRLITKAFIGKHVARYTAVLLNCNYSIALSQTWLDAADSFD